MEPTAPVSRFLYRGQYSEQKAKVKTVIQIENERALRCNEEAGAGSLDRLRAFCWLGVFILVLQRKRGDEAETPAGGVGFRRCAGRTPWSFKSVHSRAVAGGLDQPAAVNRLHRQRFSMVELYRTPHDRGPSVKVRPKRCAVRSRQARMKAEHNQMEKTEWRKKRH